MTTRRLKIARANLAQLIQLRDWFTIIIEQLATMIAAAVQEVAAAEDDERQEKETDSE